MEGGTLMWTDQKVEQHLRELKSDQVFPVVTSALVQKTQEQTRALYGPAWYNARRLALALILTLVVHITIPGITARLFKLTISELTSQEWLQRIVALRESSKGPIQVTPPEEIISLDEIREMGRFPLRVPSWLPQGAKEVKPISGWLSPDGKSLLVNQAFVVPTQDGDKWITIMQHNMGDSEVTFPPNTIQTEIAGYPAFISPDDYTLSINDKGDIESATINKSDHLTVLVQEESGDITVIRLGGQAADSLKQIAESMFTAM